MSYKQELEVSIEIAYEAGKIGLQYCLDREKKKTELQIETKSDNSEVTIADKQLNDLITKKLQKTFPNYRIIGEESINTISEDLGKGFVFYVDPIDGTKGEKKKNFFFFIKIQKNSFQIMENGQL